MLFGASKIKITPPLGTWMAGYGFRDHGCESVSEDIFIRTQAEISGNKRLIFIYADLERWEPSLVMELRALLKVNYGLEETELFFCASHSHSGPITGSDGLIAFKAVVPFEYIENIKSAAVKAVGEALGNLIEVSIKRYNGKCCQNVFRRVWEDGHTIMAPNYDVPVDRNLTVISMTDMRGSIVGLQVHYPCHANLANGYDIHPDYPGIALRMLDEKLPGCISIFMQGCTGDIRPNSVCGDKFVPAQYDKVLVFAERFVDRCIETMKGHPINVGDNFNCTIERLGLPVDGRITEEELLALKNGDDGFRSMWASVVLDRGNPKFEILEMMAVKYSEGLEFLAMNGEVVQEYAAYARTVNPDAISVAYANGMISYIPTAKEIIEGGYESRESPLWFGLAGCYSLEIEPMIKERIRALL